MAATLEKREDTLRTKMVGEGATPLDISELPEIERIAVTLYYLEDLRLKEIGQALNLSESRVSRLIKSAEHQVEEYVRAKENGAGLIGKAKT